MREVATPSQKHLWQLRKYRAEEEAKRPEDEKRAPNVAKEKGEMDKGREKRRKAGVPVDEKVEEKAVRNKRKLSKIPFLFCGYEHSEDFNGKRQDSPVASEVSIEHEPERAIPSLRDDILWSCLTLNKPGRTGVLPCSICGKHRSPLASAKQHSWRVYNCGHFYHVSCFRDLIWLDADLKFCVDCKHCAGLRGIMKTIPAEQLRFRVLRMDRMLLPQLVDFQCPSRTDTPKEKVSNLLQSLAGENTTKYSLNNHPSYFVLKGQENIPLPIRPKPEELEKQKQAEEQIQREKKQKWRLSIPISTDMAVLEKAWKLNPMHPIFEGIEKENTEGREEIETWI